MPARCLLAAPDKFRGSLSAREAARAMAEGARAAGWDVTELPLSDGGEGTLDALGGPNMTTRVTGPLGDPVWAGWRLQGTLAVIEIALVSGLSLAGGAEGNDPWAATTRGTGELIEAAIAAGARDIVVCVGGSATTDGGRGAVEALGGVPFRGRGVSVRVACDVRTRFVDAARIFGPQKGAGPELVPALTERLQRLQRHYATHYGVDLSCLPGAGAAGGLAGGLAALGAELVPGFGLIAAAQGLEAVLAKSDAVVSGEGRLDETSFEGKVVGEVADLAKRQGRPFLAVVGSTTPGMDDKLSAVSLSGTYGDEAAWERTHELVATVTREWLAGK